MDVVAHVIAIGENPATGAYGQGKRKAALIIVAARVHPRLHQAFAYLVRIKELGEMPYQIKIHRLSNSLLPKYAGFRSVHGNYPNMAIQPKKNSERRHGFSHANRIKLMRAFRRAVRTEVEAPAVSLRFSHTLFS
jgi:hypothetical protein